EGRRPDADAPAARPLSHGVTTSSGSATPSEWPGQRLGFNREGRGSVARPGRRIAALLIDFAFCYVIYFAFFFENPFASSIIFFIEQVVLMSTLGGGL